MHFNRLFERPVLPARPRKILVVKLRAMGDTVLMTAPLAELSRSYPQAEIHVLVLKPWAPLLDDFPGISRVWTYERHRETAARAKALTRLALQIRRERYDWVVNFHASPSSATLCFATGARVRAIHFHGLKDKNRYSTVKIIGKGVVKPNIERDMDVLRSLGLSVTEGHLPRIPLLQSERTDAENWAHGLGLTGPILGLGLGASRPAKSWALERFAQAAIEWRRKKKGSVVAFAGPDESARVSGFLAAVQATGAKEADSIITENRLGLRQLAACLSRCSVFLGNDSGPRHLGLAVGTPTVTLFGPEHPLEWHPYPKLQHPYFFIEGLHCRKDAAPGMPAWCGLHECVIEKHRCMTEIGVNEVLSECMRVSRS